MRHFGLIGYPLGHSFSATFFSEKFRNEGLDCRYENFPLEDISLLPALIESRPEVEGFNVTIPYKERILPYIDRLDASAEAVGAVNCVKIVREEGKALVVGYNTDCYGFECSLSEMLGGVRPSALILGTGGASKAVEYVLEAMGISFVRVSRMAAEGVITYADLSPDVIENNILIINTTPLGTFPNVDMYPPIDYSAITPAHFLHDLVYNPALTSFLNHGRRQGATLKNGSRMLEEQALKSWDIWSMVP